MVTNPRLIPFAIASSTGELADANQVLNNSSNQTGLINGSRDVQIALDRVDATGIGAPIFAFTGDYSAQNSNISEWFNGQANRHLQGASGQADGLRTFTLPGSTVLGTIFDQLSTAGLPELYRITISYLGGAAGSLVTANRLLVSPRVSPAPQIDGRTSVTLAHGDQVTLEISRTSGTISSYNVIAEGRLAGSPAGDTLDDIQLQSQTWDASASGALPTGVLQGYAYKVVNAPTDGSGRFGEVLYTDDWVVWSAETFDAWTSTNNWFVIAAGDVRRLTLQGQVFLEDVGTRTRIVRGVDYADSAGEIRLQIYDTAGDYTPADLNTNGAIDALSVPGNRDGARIAIRLSGTTADNAAVLPTLDVYEEDVFGNFNLVGNMSTGFTAEGNFGNESDYVASADYDFSAGSTVRIYVQTTQTLNTISDYDALDNVDDGSIEEVKLSSALRRRIGTDAGSNTQLDEQRISSLESKMNTLFPLSPDVGKLTGWADIFDPEAASGTVTVATGYSGVVDYRGGGTRYQQAGVTYSIPVSGTVRYTGLSANEFRAFGFRVSGPSDDTLMWLRDGTTSIPFVRITSAGLIQLNHYTPATTQDETVTNQFTRVSLTSGTETLTTAAGVVATYTATAFPASATNTSRSMQVGLDVLVNGVDTEAEGLVEFNLPADNSVATGTVSHDVFLGPIPNRTVSVTIRYTTRVSGSDLLVDINLIAAPTDVTIRLRDVGVFRTYTAPSAVARVDNWTTFQDAGGNYVFSGDVNFLFNFAPLPAEHTVEAVGALRTADGTIVEFNDITVQIPDAGFDSVEIQTAGQLSGSEFRTFSAGHYLSHSEVAGLLPNSAQQWCYGLAALTANTEHAVTEAVDFTAGVILTSPDSSRWLITVDDTGALSTTKQP